MDDPQKKFNQAFNELCSGGRAGTRATVKKLAELIAAGASPSAMTIPLWSGGGGGNTSALIVAASRGWESLISLFLLDETLDVDAVDVDGDHALLAALKSGRRAEANRLLPRSAVSRTKASRESCLSVAISGGLADEAKEILERMSHAERQQELEEMRERILEGDGAASEKQLEAQMMAMLLSKIEEEVLDRAADGAVEWRASDQRRTRCL